MCGSLRAFESNGGRDSIGGASSESADLNSISGRRGDGPSRGELVARCVPAKTQTLRAAHFQHERATRTRLRELAGAAAVPLKDGKREGLRAARSFPVAHEGRSEANARQRDGVRVSRARMKVHPGTVAGERYLPPQCGHRPPPQPPGCGKRQGGGFIAASRQSAAADLPLLLPSSLYSFSAAGFSWKSAPDFCSASRVVRAPA